MRIAIGAGKPQQGTVVSHGNEVHAPCVDSDRNDVDSFLCCGLQPFAQPFVKREDIPVEALALPKNGIREPCQLLKRQVSVLKRT